MKFHNAILTICLVIVGVTIELSAGDSTVTTEFLEAIKRGDLEQVAAGIDSGADLGALSGDKKETPIMLALYEFERDVAWQKIKVRDVAKYMFVIGLSVAVPSACLKIFSVLDDDFLSPDAQKINLRLLIAAVVAIPASFFTWVYAKMPQKRINNRLAIIRLLLKKTPASVLVGRNIEDNTAFDYIDDYIIRYSSRSALCEVLHVLQNHLLKKLP